MNRFLIFIAVLLMTSCSVSNNSNNQSIDVNEVLGSWHITKVSLRRVNSDDNKTEEKIITSFELNSDYTAIVSFGESKQKRRDGTWTWQAEKKLGNKNFGISVKSDVVVRVNGLYTLGLQIREEKEKMILTAGDYTFEK